MFESVALPVMRGFSHAIRCHETETIDHPMAIG